jgi:hypothetical protein
VTTTAGRKTVRKKPTRRAKAKKKRGTRRKARPSPEQRTLTRGPRLTRVITKKLKRKLSRGEVLGMLCRVMSVEPDAESILFSEPLAGKQFALPVPTFKVDGGAVRALGLKAGQEVWLSLRA